MKETGFKALMYMGDYVDSNLLEKGIYSASEPKLYDKCTTIEWLEKRARMTVDMTGACFISERYFDNLRKCELVDVSVVIKTP